MKKFNFLLLIAILCLTGCAGTLPTNSYTPQNIIRTSGDASIGTFKYLPYENGKVKENQIENTAIGSIYISSSVSEFVKRVNALELEKSGIMLVESSENQVSANILEFKADDLGYSVDWHFSIEYFIKKRPSNEVVFTKIVTTDPKKTGKFGLPSDYANLLGDVVLSAYDIFIRDLKVREILEKK